MTDKTETHKPQLQVPMDGLFLSPTPPWGASVLVLRNRTDVLLLRKRGDWSPPAVTRLPDEPIASCAARALDEIAGMALPMWPIQDVDPAWAVFVATTNGHAARAPRPRLRRLRVGVARRAPAVGAPSSWPRPSTSSRRTTAMRRRLDPTRASSARGGRRRRLLLQESSSRRARRVRASRRRRRWRATSPWPAPRRACGVIVRDPPSQARHRVARTPSGTRRRSSK